MNEKSQAKQALAAVEQPRITGVKVEEMPPEFGNPAWRIICQCSDGKARMLERFLSHTKPHLQTAQYEFNKFPFLFAEIA